MHKILDSITLYAIVKQPRSPAQSRSIVIIMKSIKWRNKKTNLKPPASHCLSIATVLHSLDLSEIGFPWFSMIFHLNEAICQG